MDRVLDQKDDKIATLERQLQLAQLKTNTPQQATPSTNQVGINAVTVKLPEFYEHDPEMWFVRAECQFRTKRIVDDLMKFDHIVQCLTEKVARRVRKIILHPPSQDRVKTLKDGLMVVYGRTQLEKDTSR